MSDKGLLNIARLACKTAVKAGASDVRAYATRCRRTELEWRNSKIDRIRESTTVNLTLSLFVEGRYSAHSTSDVRLDAVTTFIEKAVGITRYLAPDKHRKLPPKERYQQPFKESLQIHDSAVFGIAPEDRTAIAKKMEASAKSVDRKNLIISSTSIVGDENAEKVCVTSNGQEIFEESTNAWRIIVVSIKGTGGRKPEGFAHNTGRQLKDLQPPEIMGSEAYKQALHKRGMKQAPTDVYDVVIENRAATGFARQLEKPLQGSSLQQKQSCFEGKVGTAVASKLLSITSDPYVAAGLASTSFDSEGMASRPLIIFEKGVLKNFFLDTYYASKLNMEPTTGTPANLIWEYGTRDCKEMVNSIEKGIFITSLLGGNSNSASGDFSYGIKGFLVKMGKIVHPVSEMNISGNILTIWKNLVEVGNDPWIYSSNRAPTLCFRKVQCSGANTKKL
jgi:PmbA protein